MSEKEIKYKKQDCFKCQRDNNEKIPTYWLFECDKCGRGLCDPCGKAVMDEIHQRSQSMGFCDYCTNDKTKFCQSCYDHMDECIVRHKELKKKHSHLFGEGKQFPDGEINREWIQKVLGFWNDCRCDERCHCYFNLIKQVKKKHNVDDFYMQEVYDPITDYMISVCYKCLDKEGNEEKLYEGFCFHGQKRDLPMF